MIFFRRKDPRKTLLLEAIEEADLLYGSEMAWAEIKGVMLRDLSKPLDPQIQFSKPRHPHRFLTKVLWFYITDELRSGRLHIYRGTLSVRGQSYRKIAGSVADHLIAFGDFKGSQNDEELALLDLDISEVG